MDKIIVKSLLKEIQGEIAEIKRIESVIRELKTELCKHSPFKIGQELKGNDWSHNGKPFIVERIFTKYSAQSVYSTRPQEMPIYFVASGFIVNKNGSKSKLRTQHAVRIDESLLIDIKG